jgi:hypothetical protein
VAADLTPLHWKAIMRGGSQNPLAGALAETSSLGRRRRFNSAFVGAGHGRAGISEAQVQETNRNSIRHGAISKRRYSMLFSLSAVGGLLIVAIGVSRAKTRRAAKPSVQTLFGKK